MPPVVTAFARRLPFTDGASRSSVLGGALVLLPQIVALALLIETEEDLVSKAVFVFAWVLLNCVWLFAFRRPGFAGAASLAMVVTLILLSQLKHSALFMTVNFVDVMIVDTDTIGFLFTVMPTLGRDVAIAAALTLPLVGLIWWLDPLRVRRRMALLGIVVCVFALWAIATAVPTDREDEFARGQYVSKFARSGVTAIGEYLAQGFLASDAEVVGHLRPVAGAACPTAAKPPHIVMVFDESSFDATKLPGVQVPAGYRDHFASFDGKERGFVVEGAGGPSWFTEYNVLTGLSVRSYGRFADFVTRIAAGRVERGLPWSLRRCGYKTYSLYSYMGAFLNAQSFQKTTGIEFFRDTKALKAKGVEPDRFFYDAATQLIAENQNRQPLFLFVYMAANHFPWDYQWRPDLTPGWSGYGNNPETDEYIRRQMLSAGDYSAFLAKLRADYPDEQFLIVRFGDHLPLIALPQIEPSLDQAGVGRLVQARDPRFFTTYYALDGVNYRPADVSLALPRLDAPYLPLVVLQAAGLPLDPSFVEQKRIMERCNGLFYQCAAGAEARRFNRLLIEAGLIKGL